MNLAATPVITVLIQSVLKKVNMILIFTGNGKGKTSAALGIAFRASGWGKKTAIVQFIKGHKEIGEWKAANANKLIDIFQFLDDPKLFIRKPREEHKKTIPNILERLKILCAEGYSLIVLDEVNNAISHGLVGVGEIMEILKANPEVDFILTGRDAPEELVEMADLVTEMKEIKHPFNQGKIAKQGIDY